MAEKATNPGRKRRAGWKWPGVQREAFLDHLAATCNVSAAAEAGGIDRVHLYWIRRSDPEFRAQWADALEAGYEMLETLLVGHAIDGGGTDITSGLGAAIDRDLALRLLTNHRNALNGKSRRNGRPLKTATSEETDKAILKKLDAIERRRAAEA